MSLLVCIGHFIYWNNINTIPVSFILCVDFFLVLSGFVLCHSVFIKMDKFDSIVFFKRRYLRLFPVYIFCVIITLPALIFLRHVPLPNLFDIFRILTISEMIPLNPRSNFPMLEPLGISYTISAELYVGVIFFPIISFILNTYKQMLFPFLFILSIACIFILNTTSISFMDAHHRLYNAFLDYSLIRCTLDYSIGAIAILILEKISNKPKEIYLTLIQISCILLCIALYGHKSYNRNNEFLAPLIFMVLIISLSFNSGKIFDITSNKIGIFLGNISYPVYLIHPLCISITNEIILTTNIKLKITIYISIVVLFSYFINKYIEKPSLELIKNKYISSTK